MSDMDITEAVEAIENKACCGLMEYLENEYDLPFERPLRVDFETGTMTMPWTVILAKLTKGGALKKSDRSRILLNYCPFCGKKLEIE